MEFQACVSKFACLYFQNTSLYDYLILKAKKTTQVQASAALKFVFSEKATKFEKIFVVLLTRASCSVRATTYLSKS